jgi:hypothetical protein
MKKPDYDKIIKYDKGFLNQNIIIKEYLTYLRSELSPKELTHMSKLVQYFQDNKCKVTKDDSIYPLQVCTSRLIMSIVIVEENRVNIFQDLGKYTKQFIDILPPYQQEAYTDFAIDQRNKHLQTKLCESFDTFKPVFDSLQSVSSQ